MRGPPLVLSIPWPSSIPGWRNGPTLCSWPLLHTSPKLHPGPILPPSPPCFQALQLSPEPHTHTSVPQLSPGPHTPSPPAQPWPLPHTSTLQLTSGPLHFRATHSRTQCGGRWAEKPSPVQPPVALEQWSAVLPQGPGPAAPPDSQARPESVL